MVDRPEDLSSRRRVAELGYNKQGSVMGEIVISERIGGQGSACDKPVLSVRIWT